MGATASKVNGPLETLDADQVHAVVAGFGTLPQFQLAARPTPTRRHTQRRKKVDLPLAPPRSC